LPNRCANFCVRTYDLELTEIVIEQPPKVEFGEYALASGFRAGQKLRHGPAQDCRGGRQPNSALFRVLKKLELAARVTINARLRREELAATLIADDKPRAEVPAGKILVEQSSINPNKAAHVGHLRNAILGDTFVRLLRLRAGKSTSRITSTIPVCRLPMWSWDF